MYGWKVTIQKRFPTIYNVLSGGFDGISHLSSVEMYDPHCNTWSKVADMSMSRLVHSTL